MASKIQKRNGQAGNLTISAVKFCYVCNKEIKRNSVYIGQNLYRHTRCHPGSRKWMKWAKNKKEHRWFYNLFRRYYDVNKNNNK